MWQLKRRSFSLVTGLISVLFITFIQGCTENKKQISDSRKQVIATKLLTEPFLQLPREKSIRVVWFTEKAGDNHVVVYGDNLQERAIATTTKLSHTREDPKSRVGSQTEDGQIYQQIVNRDIWRHEAEITGLTPGKRVKYQVTSIIDGASVSSKVYSLAPKPQPGTNLKILLTSDHQLKPMTAANLQKAAQTEVIDGVFMAGDLINIPDRASEWFDDNRGGAFFPSLQGRANYKLDQTTYIGGAIIQHAPIFTAIGNHEVTGRRGSENLDAEFNDPIPRKVAKKLYGEASLKANSFNSDTYEEIFTLPQSKSGGEKYYATTFGDVRLVTLYATNIWRSPSLKDDAKGKYREKTADLDHPQKWGYGQHIFEPISPGSPQYNWLVAELQSQEFKNAKYKVVMFHHPVHSLGENIVPAYTDPVQTVIQDDNRKITDVRYEYPLDKDYLNKDIVPLLEAANVDLVFFGHSHLWNRFQSKSGMHFLETSNVGNTYGAYLGDNKRNVPQGYKQKYVEAGDPNGLEPIVPTIKPLMGKDGQPLPYIASNEISVFSILDTSKGTLSSYRFDTKEPNDKPIKFDEFKLK